MEAETEPDNKASQRILEKRSFAPDGSYVRRMPGADAVDCQAQFYEEAYQANVHSSLK